MRYESYVEYEYLIGSEMIVTYDCLVDTINDDRTESYFNCSWRREDLIMNIEMIDGRDFNVVIPADVFNFGDYKTSTIRRKEVGNSDEMEEYMKDLEGKIVVGQVIA